jgi:TOMM system kinase/cyclase fusion protein
MNMMDFYSLIDQVLALLRQRGRVSYRALKRQFHLDDATLADLTAELLYAHHPVAEEAGSGLVWLGDVSPAPEGLADVLQPETEALPSARGTPPTPSAAPSTASRPSEAERRQLTVLFCDLVNSTALAGELDPEDFREVVRAYQATCAAVIQEFAGHVAQYLGDGLLVYFGYPHASEDDAQRAVHAGLGVLDAMRSLNTRLDHEHRIRLAVRLGIHTGLVVVGEVGGGGRQEQLALGETPNIAARLQALAEPDTVVISEATAQLIHGYFVCQALGAQKLKGQAQPLPVYRVLHESEAHTRLDVETARGLTPLVGREQEVGLLVDRWERAIEGMGQVVLLTGEAGIGKSRLVQLLRDRIGATPAIRIEYRCSPHAQHSALYPVIMHLERALAFTRTDSPTDKLRKLEDVLASYSGSLAEMVPLYAALLSLPLGEGYPPLTLTPQRQRQKTLEALLTWLWQETERHPVLFVIEDLHWVDPSTLELLDLAVDQSATARILILVTCRPEFEPSWPARAHLTTLTLTRLPRPHVERMVASVARTKALPRDVVQQIIAKTDGVPLFVEELTKTVLESGLLREHEDHYELKGPLPALAIPATLQDSLMARLDRLSAVKAVAQLGATIGRQFAYDLLQAVSPLEEGTLQKGLRELVAAELLYQRGMPPQATYIFKHALIQDAAYQSLLKSTRQQHHQRIAQVLEERFAELVETQPELLAHHYTGAGLPALAIPYWQRAGQRALQRSASQEAISHATRGLELLLALPETPARAEQELLLQTTLGPALLAAEGYAAPEVGRAYTRAWALCQQGSNMHQIVPVQYGLWVFHIAGAEYETAHELAAQLFSLAQGRQDPIPLLAALRELGGAALMLGDLVPARGHLEQALALYEPERHGPLAFRYGHDIGSSVLAFLSLTLWLLGYPDQASQKITVALSQAQGLAHANSLASTLVYAAVLRQFRGEVFATRAQSEAALNFATSQQIPFWSAMGTILRGWALSRESKSEEGIAEIQQGLRALQGTGARYLRSYWLALLAEAYGVGRQPAAGLAVLDEALETFHSHGERYYEAELHRLRGELLLQAGVSESPVGDPLATAEACFHQALDIARRQQAKSLELRAAMSLSRLWQRQGRHDLARELLADVYGWFTEGFDAVDVREARALLEALGPTSV